VPGTNDFKIMAKDAALNPSAAVNIPTILGDHPQNEYLPLSQPQPINTAAERAVTLQQWNDAWIGKGADRLQGLNAAEKTLILDVLTTLRKAAPDFWEKFRRQINNIYVDKAMPAGVSASLMLPNAAYASSGARLALGPAFFGKTTTGGVDWNTVGWPRRSILNILVHEGYHHPSIAGSLDALYGVQASELAAVGTGSATNEEKTEWRAIKTLSFIGQSQGWVQVYGNDDFHFTDANHAYQEVRISGQQTPVRYYYSFQAFNFAAAMQRPLSTNPYWTYGAGRPGGGAYFINNAVLFGSGRTLLKVEF
jgi:hypothetical protein